MTERNFTGEVGVINDAPLRFIQRPRRLRLHQLTLAIRAALV